MSEVVPEADPALRAARTDAPREAGPQAVPGPFAAETLGSGSRLLINGRVGDTTLQLVLIRPARGLALLEIDPVWTPDAPKLVRARLYEAGFGHRFPGHLPIMHRQIHPQDVPRLEELLAEAFVGLKTFTLDRHAPWEDAVQALLTPGPAASGQGAPSRPGRAVAAMQGRAVAATQPERGALDRRAGERLVVLASDALASDASAPGAAREARPAARSRRRLRAWIGAAAASVAGMVLLLDAPRPVDGLRLAAGVRDMAGLAAAPPLQPASVQATPPVIMASAPGLHPLAPADAAAPMVAEAWVAPRPLETWPAPESQQAAAEPDPAPPPEASALVEAAPSDPPPTRATVTDPVEPPPDEAPQAAESARMPPASEPAASEAAPVETRPATVPQAGPPEDNAMRDGPSAPDPLPAPVVAPMPVPVPEPAPAPGAAQAADPLALPPEDPQPQGAPSLAGPASPVAPEPPALPKPPALPAAPPVAASPATAAPAPAAPALPAAVRPAPAMSPADIEVARRRGEALLALGDISGGRRFLERAARAGSGAAALAMAESHDPRMLAARGVIGMPPDRAAALDWYRRALALGMTESASRIATLEAER